jgi:hypothetical protein
MAAPYQQMFVGKNLEVLIELVNAYFGQPDAMLEVMCSLPGIPAATRSAMTKPSTKNTLNGLAPIEYLAGGLLKHSSARPGPTILTDWAMGTAYTPMRINRIRMLAIAFFA